MIDSPVAPGSADASKLKLLSERELEVCQLAVDGITNPRIAEMLNVSPMTIKVHLRTAFKKLNINHRIELIRFMRPRQIPFSKRTDFDPGDLMILDLISQGLKDQEVADVINANATDDNKVSVQDIRVIVQRLRRWTDIDNRHLLAIWWLAKKGVLSATDA